MSHLPPPIPGDSIAPLPMTRSVSVPPGVDGSIEHGDGSRAYFSPSLSPPAGSAANVGPPAGHAHYRAVSMHAEPQTPNEYNSSHAATVLMHGLGSMAHLGAGERRGSKGNLRLQSQAPPKLAHTQGSATFNVPLNSMLVPASPATPSLNPAAPPPTPMLPPSDSSEPITPLFDQPFSPPPVPPSPMLPQAPPPSPFPQMSLSASSSASPSPLLSPYSSPHPPKQTLSLPATLGGVDILERDEETNEQPPPLPAEPDLSEDEGQSAAEDEGQPTAEDVGQSTAEEGQPAVEEEGQNASVDGTNTMEEGRPSVTEEERPPAAEEEQVANVPAINTEEDEIASVDGTNTVEVEVSVNGPRSPSSVAVTPVETEKVFLHRSKLGRLSIIQRDVLKGKGLLPSPTGTMTGPASAPSLPTFSSPTAVCGLSEAELAAASKKGAIVTSVSRVQHVAFDPNATDTYAALKNVPPEWQEALKQQFGLPPTLCQSVKLSPYASRIPLVLVRLHEFLKSERAFETTVGIFRLAPDSGECSRLKAMINTNVSAVDTVTDKEVSGLTHCVATLLKQWFRDLPVPLLQPIPPEAVAQLNNDASHELLEGIIRDNLKEPSQSIYRWLLDLACEVTLHSETNKMVAKNTAICFSPNLYRPRDLKPGEKQNAAEAMKMMNTCKHYTNFLELCIGMREEQRGQKKTSLV